MWLLDTTTLKLRQFVTDIPDYVILSHTWGDGEVGFDDIAKPYAMKMAGYAKIWECCAQALKAGFEWAWVDTCCIDKRSSAELSEAINSMYKWYWNAAICYVYISDCSLMDGTLQSSRWFKRGWTLQELLAPDIIEFYDWNWRFMGTKSSLLDQIYAATNIEKQYLLDRDAIENATVAAKFSWASDRTTTREEDMAYCLLGLVQVNMPMLYGEGQGAFYRLQLEIIKQTNDHTIFAWESAEEDTRHYTNMLAPSPARFKDTSGFRPTLARVQGQLATHEMTNHGLGITLPCISVDHNRVVAVLNCEASAERHVGIWLECTGPGTYRRLALSRAMLTEEEIGEAAPVTMHVEISSQTQVRQVNSNWSMRGFKLPNSGVVNAITTGSRLAVVSVYPFLQKKEGLLLLRDLVLQNDDFVSFSLSLSKVGIYMGNHYGNYMVNYMLFFGLHKGRPWIDISIDHYSVWIEEMEKKRKVFEAQTQDQPDFVQQSCFGDYRSVPIEGGGTLRVLARKTRSSERLEWGVTISTFGFERPDDL